MIQEIISLIVFTILAFISAMVITGTSGESQRKIMKEWSKRKIINSLRTAWIIILLFTIGLIIDTILKILQ